ncbi:Unknown protein, partial [Striga hermonthica]
KRGFSICLGLSTISIPQFVRKITKSNSNKKMCVEQRKTLIPSSGNTIDGKTITPQFTTAGSPSTLSTVLFIKSRLLVGSNDAENH